MCVNEGRETELKHEWDETGEADNIGVVYCNDGKHENDVFVWMEERNARVQ